MSELTCEVCNKNKAIGVASVPGIPCSAAYCTECLKADAHPLNLVVANTACMGGMEYAAPWWKKLVESTLKHLDVSREKFDEMVAESLKEIS